MPMVRWCLRLGLFLSILAATVTLSVCGSQPSTTAPTPAKTYAISGTVSDAASGRPIASATVGTANSPAAQSTTTDANGNYTIRNIPGGVVTLHAEAAAYTATDKTVTVQSDMRADLTLQPIVVASPQCDASLWNHMHDPKRIKTLRTCQTVTGTIATVGTSDDGDYDMQLTLDAPYANLLNSGNITKLNGNLQIEAICQSKVHPDVPDAIRACANFTGTVPIPPVGAHVQVTGTYVLDSDHGWNEIHPISVLTIAR